jgi:biotin carboxyl carrier protein
MYTVKVKNKIHRVKIKKINHQYQIKIGDKEIIAKVLKKGKDRFCLIVGSRFYEVEMETNNTININGNKFTSTIIEKTSPFLERREKKGEEITIPMPGLVIKLKVKEGEEVVPGKGLVIIEAMKMQNEVKATQKGRVKEIKVKEGENVQAGEVIMIIE